MKNTTTLNLSRDEAIVLAVALQSLSALRLDLYLPLKAEDPCVKANNCKGNNIHDLKGMCDSLDYVVDNPSAAIARLINALDSCAG